MAEMEVNVCFCLFVLNQCSLLASSFSGKLLYSNDTSIMEFDIDTRNLTVLVEQGSSVYGMDYDYKNRFIYFPRYNIYDIARFPYPSENRTLQTIVQTEQYPIGIAVDSANGHIYWTDISTHELSRCVLDGTNVTIISTISNSWAIRLDVTKGWMYIAEYNLGIFKSRFNLEEKQTIVSFTSGGAYCMDIDTDGNRLYWINVDGDMNSAKVDGSDVKTILSTNVHSNYYAIGVFGSQIYYANEYHQLLLVTKIPGSNPTVLYNDTSEVHSIFVFNQAGMHIIN
ncbi:low-density lipoprotein receptor-related protein 6-like [Mytilus californianus]|uniref:low-density lipoprotein receptor-related protein 6-like n=1 Tax=Mytilus californianus TaxID=6549 RepID=UPI002246A8EB|nr:low-density lipoprotein receptor-related protein 6-like [Mytilus californianus]